MAKGDLEVRTFDKLKGSENYKEWAREMEFALIDVGLMGLVTGDRIRPLQYTEEQKEAILKKEYGDERIKRREEAIEKWDINDGKVVGKIGGMCTKTVQMEFKSGWNAKTTWDSLKKRYTPHGWSSKWALLNRLEETSYAGSIDVPDFGRKMRTILEEIKDQQITRRVCDNQDHQFHGQWI